MTQLLAAAQVVLLWHPRHVGSLPMTPDPAEGCSCRWRGRRCPHCCCRCSAARPGPPRAG
jgi:hypothetical protein